ncbi:MAG: hypothetical protein V1738_03040 [Patescibacteria group bacterium]
MNSDQQKEAHIVLVVGSYFVAKQRPDGVTVPNHARIEQNIYAARNVARMVMELNQLTPPLGKPVLAVTPHSNTAHFEQLTDVSEPVYQAGDRELIRLTATALIAVPNYVISSGTSKEIRLANELGIPVFEDLQSLRMFLANPRQTINALKGRTVRVRDLDVNLSWHPNRTCVPLTMEDVMFFDHLDQDCVPVRFYADLRGFVRADE